MAVIPTICEIDAARGTGHAAALALDRGARTPRLVDVERDVGSALRELCVVVVGCGSVGLHLADVAARSGVHSLLLVDPARLKPASLLTHVCLPGELGRPKVRVAGERAKAVSPRTRVFCFRGGFEALPVKALGAASHVLLASDNLRCELAVAQRALELGLNLIQASVYGPTLTAQVRAIASRPGGDGPCSGCAFGATEWEELDRNTLFSCNPAAASHGAEPSRVPTASLPHLCAMAAQLAFMELTRLAVGLGKPGESRVVEYCGYTHNTVISPIARRASCPMDHSRARLEPVQDLGKATLRALLCEAGYAKADPRRVTLSVEGRCFASLAACECRDHPRVGRFVKHGASAGPCRRCGALRAPHPFDLRDEVPVIALADRLDRTLASLGARAPGCVRVRGDQGAVLFHERWPDDVERGGIAG